MQHFKNNTNVLFDSNSVSLKLRSRSTQIYLDLGNFGLDIFLEEANENIQMSRLLIFDVSLFVHVMPDMVDLNSMGLSLTIAVIKHTIQP